MTNKIITAIIIEDDKEAMSLLEIYLKAFPEIEIIDKTINPQIGIRLLKKKMPNIVFLDIDMPEVNGIEVAEVIKEYKLNTEIIFTTAHSKYAFKSLKVEPLDFLVKPFGPDEIISVVNRYETKTKQKELDRQMDILIRNNNNNPKIKLTTKFGIIFVNPEDIMLIQSFTNHSYIYLNNGTSELIIQKMCRIMELINLPNFVKASRASIINTQYLIRIDKKNKVCILNHQNHTIEEPINRSSMSFLEKLNCFPIN